MSLTTTSNKVQYNGNGVAINFGYAFRIDLITDVVVVYTNTSTVDTILTTAEFDINGLGDDSGGIVTYPKGGIGTKLQVGELITITRSVPITQTTDITNQTSFLAEVVEDSIDKRTMVEQQLNELISRCFVMPVGSTLDPADLFIQIQAYVTLAGASAAAALISENNAAQSVLDCQAEVVLAHNEALAAAASALAAAASALSISSLVETADTKHTTRGTLSTGWIWASGKTIGAVGSNSTERENADTEDLFTIYFDDYTDTELPILTSAGGATTRVAQTNAATAWAANCQMSVPDLRGRSLVGRDDMGGAAASRITVGESLIVGSTLGASGGVETHLLAGLESGSAVHSHGNTIVFANPAITGSIGSALGNVDAPLDNNVGAQLGNGVAANIYSCGDLTGVVTSGIRWALAHTHTSSSLIATQGTKSGGVTDNTVVAATNKHQNTQPSYICNIMIKL